MADPSQPNLGYGKQSEVRIDTFNKWFRARPEYQAQLKAWGQDPNNVHLSKSQSQQLLRMAQGLGAVVDEGNMEVDPAGNFNPKGHKLRNTLIVAGIAGATLATMGAAGAFSGAGGAAGGASSGASAAAGTLGPSTAANMAATSAIAGGSAVPASLAATGAGAAGAAGAAAAGLGPSTAENMAATSAIAGGSAIPASLDAAGIGADIAGAGRTAAGLAGDATKKATEGMSLKDVLGLLGVAIPGIAALTSGKSETPKNPLDDLVPQLKDSLNMELNRSKRQDPLHAALTQMAMNFLPRSSMSALAGRPDVSKMTPYAPSSSVPPMSGAPTPNTGAPPPTGDGPEGNLLEWLKRNGGMI